MVLFAGTQAIDTTSDNTGSISAQGTIGNVQVLGLGDDANPKGLIGGGGKSSGSIIAVKKIGTVTCLIHWWAEVA
jgi:hypothetical protein